MRLCCRTTTNNRWLAAAWMAQHWLARQRFAAPPVAAATVLATAAWWPAMKRSHRVRSYYRHCHC
jgi:hypothetical protein